MDTMGSTYPDSKRLFAWMFPDPLRFPIMHQHRHCVLTKEPVLGKSKRLASFTLFRQLPPELRIKIWQTIASARKYVEIGCVASLEEPSGRWFSHSPTPILLSICQESRTLALSYYSTLEFSEGQIGIPCQTPVYINFVSEALWLCGDLHERWAIDLLSKNHQLQDHLRFLVVDSWLWDKLTATDSGTTADKNYCWPEGKRCISKLGMLEDVIFRS